MEKRYFHTTSVPGSEKFFLWKENLNRFCSTRHITIIRKCYKVDPLYFSCTMLKNEQTLESLIILWSAFTVFRHLLNPFNFNPTKWSNTLKQFVGKMPTNCLSVFDHFVRPTFNGLSTTRRAARRWLSISWCYLARTLYCFHGLPFAILTVAQYLLKKMFLFNRITTNKFMKRIFSFTYIIFTCKTGNLQFFPPKISVKKKRRRIFQKENLYFDKLPQIRRNINSFMHNIEKWPNIFSKSCAVNTAKFLKYVWPFFNIIHENVNMLT